MGLFTLPRDKTLPLSKAGVADVSPVQAVPIAKYRFSRVTSVRSMNLSTIAGPPSAFHLRVLAETLGKRRSSLEEEQILETLGSSLVDLNPHQIDAALKAYRGPLQTGRGILLADEVGLGKTVEALLIVAQYWAKHRRRILLLVPASLRTQWKDEIEDKFGIPAEIADRETLRVIGDRVGDAVIISTPQSIYRQIEVVKKVRWDLMVIDEAHRLRNVYRGTKTATAIRDAFEDVPKILLSATPIQNKVDELFGLMTFIDPNLFGGLDLFRHRYFGGKNVAELRSRLEPYIARTLRRQVREYIRFTERHCIVHNFRASQQETKLYDQVAAFLRRDRIPAFRLTNGGSIFGLFILLVYWRLLASSTAAIARALTNLEARLESTIRTGIPAEVSSLVEDADAFAEELEVLEGEEADPEQFTREEMEAELEWVRRLARMAREAEAASSNEKAEQVTRALQQLFAEAEAKGYPQKAVIFTEFIATQEFLAKYLEKLGFAGQITLFNGQVRDAATRRARIEEFRNRTRILISTEAGAEGLNLQFCNVIINYDLPWNPQRIEQRIGRCHRYGQEHDVIVCNFVNLENEAEERLHELLQIKLRLFDGVLGASDEVLGTLGSGLDFERRVLSIFQQCRTPDEIRNEFTILQKECEDIIQAEVHRVASEVLDTFDQDVVRRLRSLEFVSDAVEAGQSQLLELLHHALPRGSLRPAALPDHPRLAVYALTLQDDLSTPADPPRLVTFERIPRDVAPTVERINLTHPLVQRILNQQCTFETTWGCIELGRPSTPRVALLDDLVARGATSGTWFLFRSTASGFETVDDLWHVVTIDGEKALLVGEAAERFGRALIRNASRRDAIPVPAAAQSEARAARDRFESRLRELYGDLYFRRREELDLRIFDEEQRMQEMIDELRDQLLETRRKANRAASFEEKERLFDSADQIQRKLNRAKRNQNEFLERLEHQKERELASLRSYRDLDVSAPVLVAGCRWTIVS